jgi:hypothetical protein
MRAEGFDVIVATPERVLVSQHRPSASGLISILKCLKLTIDIIFQCHFIAHLTRSNAREITPTQIPAQRQRHETQTLLCCHDTNSEMAEI